MAEQTCDDMEVNENSPIIDTPSLESQADALTRVVESFEKYMKLSSINCPPPTAFDVNGNIEIQDFFEDFEEFCAVKYRHSEKNWTRVLGGYLKGEIKEVFTTINETTNSYVEIKEELIEYIEKARKKIRKEKVDEFFLLKRKIGEKLNVYDMRLTAAAKNCFTNPKGEDVQRYKKIKIMEEIDEEVKEQLKYSTVLMDEEPNYEQLLEALVKLEGIKNEKEQETKVLKAGLEIKSQNPNKKFEEMGARPRNTRGVNNDNINSGEKWKKNNTEVRNDYCTYCYRNNHNYTNCFLRLGTCYNCGKGGHLSYECPQKKNSNNYRRENNSSSSKINNRQKYEETPKREEERSRNMMCLYCGEMGHVMKFCPDWMKIQKKLEDTKKCRSSESQKIENETALFVTAKMGNKVYKALVDTGADRSLVNKNVCKDQMEKIIPMDIRIEGINKETRQAEGIMKLNIELGNRQFSNFPFIVIDNIDYDIVIGADFFRKYKILIDMAEDRLMYREKGETVIIRLLRDVDSESNSVRTATKVSIPPKSSQLVQVWGNRISDIEDVYIEPILIKNGLTGNGTISNGSKLKIEIINVTNEKIVMKKNTIVGRCYEIEENNENEPQYRFNNMDSEINHGKNWIKEFKLEDAELSKEQVKEVIDILKKHTECIGKHDMDMGYTDRIKHTIELTTQIPIRHKVRRFPKPLSDKIEQLVDQYLANGVVRPSMSPYNNRIVPVVKPDGSIRLCLDLRDLNAITKKMNYPIPFIEDYIYNLHGRKWFSKIDLVQGYFQVDLDEDSRKYVAFSTASRHVEFNRAAMGLVNIPFNFQRLMNMALQDLPSNKVWAYLDDILISTTTYEEHISILDQVLNKLREYGLKIKPKKCELLRKEVDYLGYHISEKGIAPQEKNIETIKNYPEPKTLKQARSFLGMVNFYRRLIPKCSIIQHPLCRLIGKKSLQWTMECQWAFEELKEKLISPPILAFPDYTSSEPLKLVVDASDDGIGGCLMQSQNGEDRSIAYHSLAFNDTQRKYTVLEKELTGIRFCLKAFRSFLLGVHFKILTDHRALVYLSGMKMLSARLTRTMEELGEYDYEIIFLPGKLNKVADALSRIPSERKDICGDLESFPAEFDKIPIPGGGDALFKALSLIIYEDRDHSGEIRTKLIDELLENSSMYGLGSDRKSRKEIRQMKVPGTLVSSEVLQAFVNYYKIDLKVYETKDLYIRYSNIGNQKIAYLKSYAGVHYDLLIGETEIVETKEEDNLIRIENLKYEFRDMTIHQLENDEEEADEEIMEEGTENGKPVWTEKEIEEILNGMTSDPWEGNSQDESQDEIDQKHLVTNTTLNTPEGSEVQEEVIEERKPEILSPNEYMNIPRMKIEQRQQRDQEMNKLQRLLLLPRGQWKNSIEKENHNIKIYGRYLTNMFIRGGIIVKKVITEKMVKYIPVGSLEMVSELALNTHRRLSHIGRNKLEKKLKDEIWHPQLYRIVSDVTRSCIDCQRNKGITNAPKPPVHRINPQRPLQLVEADLMALPKTTKGSVALLVVIDHFSKWATAAPLKNKTAATVVYAMENRVLPYLVGNIEEILTDNGPEFGSRVFDEMCNRFNIKHRKTTPLKPTSTGAVERLNRTLKNLLKCSATRNKEWDDNITKVLMTYNRTWHEEIQSTPLEAMEGKIKPIEKKRLWKKGSQNFHKYAIGDLVMVKVNKKDHRLENKLSPNYVGTYRIIEENRNNNTYVIEDVHTGKVKKVDHTQIRLIIDPPDYLKQVKEIEEIEPKKSKMEDNEKSTFYGLKLKGLAKMYWWDLFPRVSEDVRRERREEANRKALELRKQLEKKDPYGLEKSIGKRREKEVSPSPQRTISNLEPSQLTPEEEEIINWTFQPSSNQRLNSSSQTLGSEWLPDGESGNSSSENSRRDRRASEGDDVIERRQIVNQPPGLASSCSYPTFPGFRNENLYQERFERLRRLLEIDPANYTGEYSFLQGIE